MNKLSRKYKEFDEQLDKLIRKKDLSTWDAVEIIASYLGCKTRDIGYAGLKDKNAMTVQSLSVHKQYEEKLKTFKHDNL